MLRRLSAYVLATTLALFTPFAADAREQSLRDLLEPVRKDFGLPALAAAVTKGGRIVAAGVVGTRVLGRDIPAKLDDRFHIGSDTKAMTATLAGMMVDEGKLRWNSTVGEVLGADLPALHPKFAAITLEQLLSHTSGIPSDTKEMIALYISGDIYDYDLPAYRRHLIGIYGKTEPVVPQASPFQYANFGYMTAGAMIEKAAGEPWDSLITRRLFAPLGLKSAGLGPQATHGRIDAPIGHSVDGGKVTPHFWGPAADGPAVLGPAGIAHLSIRDFARWAAWNAAQGKRGPVLVKAGTLENIHRARVTMEIANPKPGTPKSGGYALGWGLRGFAWSGEQQMLTHNGSNSMNLATVLVDVRNDIAIVVATNFPGEKADNAVMKVVEMLYGRFGAKRPR